MTARVAAMAALMVAIPLAAQAGPKEDVIDALLKCADIADKDSRVTCFDAATPQLRAAVGLPTATIEPVPSQASPPAGESPHVDASSGSGFFASLNPFSGDPAPSPQQMAYQPMGQEILPVAIGVARFGPSDSGGFEITLDNGQVWQERNEHYDIPPWRSDARNIVYIERGMLGGYNLYLRPFGKIYKVVRVK